MSNCVYVLAQVKDGSLQCLPRSLAEQYPDFYSEILEQKAPEDAVIVASVDPYCTSIWRGLRVNAPGGGRVFRDGECIFGVWEGLSF